MLRIIAILTVLVYANLAAAADFRGLLDIRSVKMKMVDEYETLETASATDCGASVFFLDEIAWDQIVTVGEKVWQIVEANKPVLNIETKTAHALPRGLNCWQDLENWRAPRVQVYEVVYKNGFGMEVVKFRFRLQYTYGGGKDGRGRYLANVSVRPSEINVIWGYSFDAKVEIGQAVNLASSSDPLAGLELNVRWNVKTVVKETENSYHYFVQGDGVALSVR